MNQSTKKLIEYVLTVRLENTPEWLEVLVEKINEYAKENSSNQRVKVFKDGLCVVDPLMEQELKEVILSKNLEHNYRKSAKVVS